MTGDPRIDWYEAATGPEAMLRFGPDDGPVVIAALPLFEEANRTRTFVVTILRALAERGIGGVLPDGPGQGESLVLLEQVTLGDMRAAFAVASDAACARGRRGYAIALRSGALLDIDAPLAGRWHLAPQSGSDLVRELSRMQQADPSSGPKRKSSWHEDDRPVEIAGNVLAAAFVRDLAVAPPGIVDRTIRLTFDPAAADRKIEGPALWRRSEPGNDVVLAERLADDIAEWIATCEG